MTLTNKMQHNIQHAISQHASLTLDAKHSIMTTALKRMLQRIDLTPAEMTAIMMIIMQGDCSDAMMGALLIALRMKGESIDEITAAASVMRQLAHTIAPKNSQFLVDIVGTGGDDANLFNVSTASAFVAAAAGAQVAKHGNKGVSSSSGSSDVLKQAGIDLSLSPQQTCECIDTQGIGFLFAPNHHQAMKHAIEVRREIKVRTIFNILGPLTNPAGVKNLVIGVFTPELCEPLAYVMKNLGARHVMVVSADDGLDEISLATTTKVAELKEGVVSTYNLQPEDAGIDSQTLIGLSVTSSKQSLTLIQDALSGKPTTRLAVAKARDMIALNAGAAIYVAGLAGNFANAVNHAQTIIEGGLASHKIAQLAQYTQTLKADG